MLQLQNFDVVMKDFCLFFWSCGVENGSHILPRLDERLCILTDPLGGLLILFDLDQLLFDPAVFALKLSQFAFHALQTSGSKTLEHFKQASDVGSGLLLLAA
ncbi:hypothetical protein [Rubinisphaera italica]|uniref:hypothetical protein n=1 Tax=Rubinisphaera italica TaxID=2527969 RepID=UPI0011B6E2ED|nr:hypothetical protein [Rubinisphaera italica]